MSRELQKDGDSFERKWAGEIVPLFPEYEYFWDAHIVPLTFRDAPDEANRSHFLRPSLKGHFIDYADVSYATFFHLAHCWHWYDHVEIFVKNPQEDTNLQLTGTGAIYCFYSHAVSAYDAAVKFCKAVNNLMLVCGSRDVFDVENRQHHTPRINRLVGGERFDELWNLICDIKRYRNTVVHERILFLQNGYLPHPRTLPAANKKHLLWQKAGLAVLGLFARDYKKWTKDNTFDRDYVPATDLLKGQLLDLCVGLRPIWREAKTAFDELSGSNAIFDRRNNYDPRDRALDRKAFERARSLGRSS